MTSSYVAQATVGWNYHLVRSDRPNDWCLGGMITFGHDRFKKLLIHQNEMSGSQLDLKFNQETENKNSDSENCRNGISHKVIQ